LKSSFGVLRNDQDFADVTLACEDGVQIETHKVILASSSPFFMELLKKNKHPHPMIYMRGLKSEALVAMVDFLYYGEANVNQECLDVFLGLAEELKLKGLTGSSSEGNIEEGLRNKVTAPEKNIEERKHSVTRTRDKQKPSNVYHLTPSLQKMCFRSKIISSQKICVWKHVQKKRRSMEFLTRIKMLKSVPGEL